MKKVSIYCDGGLGNRFCTLIGGIHLSKKLNCDFEIIWPQKRWCNCYFDDLFEKNISFRNTNEIVSEFIRNNNISLFITHIDISDNNNVQLIWQTNSINYDKINKHDKIVYYHNSLPSYINEIESSVIMSEIKINNNILNEVKDFTDKNNINYDTLGLHIRRTDSPFITKDNFYFNYISGLNNKQIFVCSDEQEIEIKLKNKFHNVITRDKLQYVEKYIDAPWVTNKLPELYNIIRDRQSVIDAFIDMLILSRTNILSFKNIGTFYQLSNIYKHVNI